MENKIDNIQVGDYTLKQWEEKIQAPPISSTMSYEDAEGLGLMRPEDIQSQGTNQLYNTLDAMGVEHPEADKQYEKLGGWDTTKDVLASLGTEASHIFAPKDHELQYESRTKFGENVKYGYRYLAGTAGFMLGGEVVAGAKLLANAGKIGKGIQTAGKLLSGRNLFKNANVLQKIGNASLSGALAGALADFNLYRPEENEGHLADNFEAAWLDFLKTDENDTDLDAKLKNVVEGFFMGMGTGNIIEFAGKPLFKRIFKNFKALNDGKEGAAGAVLQDQAHLERFVKTADLVEEVRKIKAEAETNGQEASQLLIDRLHPEDNIEAQKMLKVLEEGDEIFPHSDGTWDREVRTWDEAYKVSPEEFEKQLKARDEAALEEKPLTREGDSAIEMQNQAIRDTWVQRQWLGGNSELNFNNDKTVKKIVKNYKDKWNIDNNIEIEIIDGLVDKKTGELIEGSTRTRENLGKPAKNYQTKIDKQKLKITKLEDKITMLEGSNKEVTDPLDNLKEELRIAKNELKELEKTASGDNKAKNIVISLDKNAPHPYATLRAELEHARDIATGEVPNQAERHFSRYEGMNEGEVASGYVYKKSQGKANALKSQQTIESFNTKVQQHEAEGFTFEKSNPDGFGENRYNLKDANGNKLGYVEYTVDENSVTIDYVLNETRRSDTPIANVGEKLIDKIIAENPNKEIHWDAISQEGIAFKESYLNKNPELKDRVEGINDSTLALQDEISYNATKGGKNERNHHSNGQELEGRGQKNISTNTGEIQTNLSGQPNNGTNRSSSTSGGATNAGGKATSTNPTQLQLDFSQTVASKTNTNDIVTGLINGEVKPITKADIETIIAKVEQLNPEISGFKWENLTKDSAAFAKKLEEIFDDEDVSVLIEALAKGDIDSLEYIVRKEMAAVEVLNTLAEAGKKLGADAPIEAKEAIISTIRHTSDYITGIKSGFGRGLNSQKPINSLLESYGATRLSSWTKEGIRTFSQSLIDEVNDIISLNFTRGQKLNHQAMIQDLIRRLLERDDTRDFVSFLLKNDEMKADYVKEIEKILTNPRTANVDTMAKALNTLINSAEYNAMFKAAQIAPDKKSFIKTIKEWCDKQGGVTSYYVHNLLSGVGSLAKNIGSGAINTLYFPARKILASFDPFIDKQTREALGNEGWRTYKCMQQSWKESWNLMKEAFISGNGKLTDIGESTLNMNEGQFKGYHELKKFDYYFQDPSKFWEGMQNFHSIMTRAMGATDEFMSQLNYRSIARSKALQEAEKKAIDAGKAMDETWINKEAEKIFKTKFDNHGKPTDVESLNEARTILYQNNLDGTMYNYQTDKKQQMREPTFVMKLAGSMQKLSNDNAFMKCMFPFVKTGANILQMSLDHNAIYMAASPLQQKLLTAQTAEGALARSQCAFGMFSLAIGSMMAFNGLITGSAPSDPKERKALFATGWKPYSVKVGDTYISYQGYEPLHGMLGFAADCANMYSTITNPDDEKRLQHFQAQILPTLVNNFLDKAAFRTGLSQLDLIMNPQDTDEWQKAIAQTAKGFLPDVALVTNTKSIGKHDVLQPKTLYERVFYRYFPEAWTPMDYRRNVFGEKQSVTGLLISSVGSQDGTPEEEALEYLSKYGYSPSEIDDVIANTGLRISQFKDSSTGRSAMDAMKEEMSTLTIQGRTLREAVRELVTSEEYQSLPDGVDLDTGARWGAKEDTKINAVNAIFLMYKQKAKKNIMKDNDYFTDSEGRTIGEATEDVKLKRLQQLNNLY